MQHAGASPIPISQFASLSLILLNPNYTNSGGGIGDTATTASTQKQQHHQSYHPLPFIVVAPTCTCTSYMAITAIEEVQDHIQNVVLQSTSDDDDNHNRNGDNNDRSTAEQNDNDDYMKQLLQEEAQSILHSSTSTTTTTSNTIQIYRPISNHGMAIHYHFIDGRNQEGNSHSSKGKTTTTPHAILISKLQSLILLSSSSSSSSSLQVNNTNHHNNMDLSGKLFGILFCVATTGASSTLFSSSLSYTLCQRMNDCMIHLQQLPSPQQPNHNNNLTIEHVKELLTSYLLVDDEFQFNNTVLPLAMDYIQLPQFGKNGVRGSSSASLMTSPLGRITAESFGFKAARRASTGIVRNVMMNVGHNHNTTNTAMNTQLPPVETGFPIQLRPNAATASRTLMDQLTILSVTEHSTFLRKYEQSGQERKANLDLTGGTNKSRFRRRRMTDTTRDADFDHFDYKGPLHQPPSSFAATTFNNTETGILKGIPTTATTSSTVSSSATNMNSPIQSPPGKLLQFKSSAKDTKRGPGSRRPVAATTSTTTSQQQPNSGWTNGTQPSKSSKLSDRIDHGSNSNNSSNNNKRMANNSNNKIDNDELTYDSRSQQSSGQHPNHHSTTMDNGSVVSHRSGGGGTITNPKPLSPQQQQQPLQISSPIGKLQINIALNEDLSCSYKLSQLSSCSVDGIVQVQVKSSVPIARSNGGIPFTLILKDPMTHIESLNENPKYATKISHNNNNPSSSFHNDSFNVMIPEQEKYFSLLKYRCTNDLRPVPIRVQAKIKTDGTYCRVALQISSNPNNESKLTDLTITMGVPITAVHGETLVTQPVGGVYDASKSSVIWCVSELGCGEKFQLQARFDMKRNNDRDTRSSDENDLNFPVLVRCQCLHVQLSGVGFEVRQQQQQQQQLMNHQYNNNAPPMDMIMKIASRFRLSHREKNS